jgi:hypothetical protein
VSVCRRERHTGPSTWRLLLAIVTAPVGIPIMAIKDRRERKRREREWASLRATATHRCKVCGALWRLNDPTEVQPEGSWSLASEACGRCCDNVAMGDQIEPIERQRQ